MPAMKEPHFFSRLPPCGQMRFPISHVADQQTYLRLFAKAEGYKAIGDASSSYLWERGTAERIKAVSPGAKIIIVLRDPVERAYSHYLMDVREGWVRAPFDQALREDWNQRSKGFGVSHLYIELGLYYDQVKRYLDLFGRSQVRILMLGNLNKFPARTVTEVFEFLELTPGHAIDTSYVGNEFGLPRWRWVPLIAGNRYSRRLARAPCSAERRFNLPDKEKYLRALFPEPRPATGARWKIGRMAARDLRTRHQVAGEFVGTKPRRVAKFWGLSFARGPPRMFGKIRPELAGWCALIAGSRRCRRGQQIENQPLIVANDRGWAED